MKVLVTGGFGLIGRSVIRKLLLAGHSVRVFDRPQSIVPRRILLSVAGTARDALRKTVLRGRRRGWSGSPPGTIAGIEYVSGDICNIADVGQAVRDMDAVIHLAALIPPAANRSPVYADYVNRGGTDILVQACRRFQPQARFIYASSVAVYGDRRHRPQIRLSDKPHVEEHDVYSAQKLAAEQIVKQSSLDWCILRLAAIMSPEKLALDPLMFEMPLDTHVEWCTAEDTGLALARAVDSPGVSNGIFHLGGGQACRSTFGEFLDRVMDVMGLGRGFFPQQAFGPGPFHCGYMDSDSAQQLLSYQNESLESYYAQVRSRRAYLRPILWTLRPLLRPLLLHRSPYWRAFKASDPVRARDLIRSGLIFAGRRARQSM